MALLLKSQFKIRYFILKLKIEHHKEWMVHSFSMNFVFIIFRFGEYTLAFYEVSVHFDR